MAAISSHSRSVVCSHVTQSYSGFRLPNSICGKCLGKSLGWLVCGTFIWGTLGSGIVLRGAESLPAPEVRWIHPILELMGLGGRSLFRFEGVERDLPPQVIEWLKEHREVVLAGRSPYSESFAWGTVTSGNHRLYLAITDWSIIETDRKITIPRLHNSVVSIDWFEPSPQQSPETTEPRKGNDKRQSNVELKLSPGIESWDIELTGARPMDIVPVIELKLNSNATSSSGTPPVVKPNADKTLELHARDAITRGTMLRFEPQPHKNTIGYWVNAEDVASWRFAIPESDEFELELRYGCGDGQEGSEIVIQVGSKSIPFRVEATGGFQAWRSVGLGSVGKLAPGEYVVEVRPVRKAKDAVMDIQQITLRPAQR